MTSLIAAARVAAEIDGVQDALDVPSRERRHGVRRHLLPDVGGLVPAQPFGILFGHDRIVGKRICDGATDDRL